MPGPARAYALPLAMLLLCGCGAHAPTSPKAAAKDDAPLVVLLVPGDAPAPRIVFQDAPATEAPALIVRAPASPPPPSLADAASPARPVSLPLRWEGMWQDTRGYQYLFGLSLGRSANGAIEGQFEWSLVEAPVGSPLAFRVGQRGHEKVRGHYDEARRKLDLEGYEVDAPALVATDVYRIQIAEDGRSFTGQSRGNGDSWTSWMRGWIAPGAPH